jgi:hypothetical protein
LDRLIRARLRAQPPEVCNLLVAPFSIGTQDLDTNVNALITDEYFGSGDQPFDLVFAFAAKGAVQFALFAHDGVQGRPKACAW